MKLGTTGINASEAKAFSHLLAALADKSRNKRDSFRNEVPECTRKLRFCDVARGDLNLVSECPLISASRFASASEQMPVRALYNALAEIGC